MPQINPTQLRTALSKLFSIGELRTLCFDLGIDYEDLEGAGKSGKALALVQFSQRHGRYDELVYRVQQLRPRSNLGTAVPAPPNIVSQQDPQQVTNVYVGGDYIEGDKVGGDKVGGDKVGGDNINVGDISGSGIAIGRDSSANVETGPTYNISGTVVGSAIGGGEVHAENIAGGDININPNPQDKADFVTQLQELKTLLQKAIAEGQFANNDDGQDAVDDIGKAIREAEKETPRAEQLQNRLETVTNLIKTGTKVGAAILNTTPVIAGLIKAVQFLF